MVYRIIHTLVRLMSYIPIPVSGFFGKMIGTAAFMVPSERKAVALDSIQKSFIGAVDSEGAKRIIRKVFIHFGRMLFEIPHILRMNRDNLSRYAVFENEVNLLNALEKGKGVFILMAHFGNWELLSAALPMSFKRTAMVVRPIDYPPFAKLVSGLRTRFGGEIIDKKGAMRRLLKAVKEEKIVGILLDQNVDWYEGVFVKFLGRWACTNKGLALIALRTGTPVIPVFPVRQGSGRFRIIFGEEVPLIRTGDKTRDVEDNTALFTAILEEYIRKYPDQWFWFHRRWKTRPYCSLPESFFPKHANHCCPK